MCMSQLKDLNISTDALPQTLTYLTFKSCEMRIDEFYLNWLTLPPRTRTSPTSLDISQLHHGCLDLINPHIVRHSGTPITMT